ncbi:MAG: hypothetical protein QM754_03075 [Tepidisphaeraceae bacterium]
MLPVRYRLADLLVTLAVVVALGTAVAGVRRQAQDDSVIIGCSAKMRQLAQALVMYQSLSNGEFPRTRYDPAKPLTAFTNPDAADPFSDAGPQPNDTSAAMFLLARTIDLPPEAFICPGATRNNLAEEDDFDRQTARQRSNFRARLHDNYSLANMYPSVAAVAAGYSLDSFATKLPATFVIASDTNPGGPGPKVATTQMSRRDMRQANSPNHERDGQNVMFADGSVQFFNSPFVGTDHDNVFTSQLSPDNLQPAGAADSVLLPAWSDGPQLTARATVNRRWVLAVGGTGILLVMAWIVRHGMRNDLMQREQSSSPSP